MTERHRAESGSLEVVIEVHVKELEDDADVAAVGEALVGVHEVVGTGVLRSQPR